MIRLNEKYSISFKHGYFQTHEHSTLGAKSKTPGAECISKTQTYAKLLRCWSILKADGVDGSKIMNAAETMLKDNQIAQSKEWFKDKAKAQAKRELLK